MHSKRGELSFEENKEENAKLKYPRAVFFVIVTEFCERFSYYGMRAILTIYMTNSLGFSEDNSRMFYHIYLLLCYAMPVVGGILSDSFLGKYKTILYICIIYAIGELMLSVSAIPVLHLPKVPLLLIALFLMGLGTGGIKPCVVALGAEQFQLPTQEKQQQQFFSIFMFTVTVGSMLSTIITPVFRTDVKCFGENTCYSLAFFFPATLTLVAIVVFVLGRRLYKTSQPETNVIVDVTKCITYGITKRGVKKDEKEHWLDHSEEKYGKQLVEDTKGFLRILIYYLPIPMFWALYEQIGSSWTLQAKRMTGLIELINYRIKPDQMQIGGVLAALSFIVAGLVEKQNELYYPIYPKSGDGQLNLFNALPCTINLTYNNDSHDNAFESFVILPRTTLLLKSVHQGSIDLLIKTLTKGGKCEGVKEWNGRLIVAKGETRTAIIENSQNAISIEPFTVPEDIEKSKDGYSKLRIIASRKGIQNSIYQNSTLEVKLMDKKGHFQYLSVYKSDMMVNKSQITKEVEPQMYQVIVVANTTTPNGTVSSEKAFLMWIELKTGGSYILFLTIEDHQISKIGEPSGNSIIYELKENLIALTLPNEVHMLWLLPQYILMACAEVLFIISGLEFTYTQAPKSLKSLLQSFWHLTNATGNFIVIVVTQLKFHHSPASEYFAFGAVMVVDMILFAVLTMKYKYVEDMPPPVLNAKKENESKL